MAPEPILREMYEIATRQQYNVLYIHLLAHDLDHIIYWKLDHTLSPVDAWAKGNRHKSKHPDWMSGAPPVVMQLFGHSGCQGLAFRMSGDGIQNGNRNGMTDRDGMTEKGLLNAILEVNRSSGNGTRNLARTINPNH